MSRNCEKARGARPARAGRLSCEGWPRKILSHERNTRHETRKRGTRKAKRTRNALPYHAARTTQGSTRGTKVNNKEPAEEVIFEGIVFGVSDLRAGYALREK